MFEPPGQLFAGGAKPRGLTRGPVVDQNVGTRDEVEEPAPVVIVAGIQHRASLVGVVKGERDGGARHARPCTAGRAAAGGLDLQYVGAEVGQQPGDRLAVADRQVEHAHTGQRQRESHHAGQRSG